MGNREKDEQLQQIHTDAIKDLSEKYGMDSQEQEDLLERYKRDAENFELVNSGKRNQQMTALKAKLAARRTKKLAGVERSCEDRAQQRADEEKEKRIKEMKLDEEMEREMKDHSDISVPIVQVKDNYEAESLAREHERQRKEMKEDHQTEMEKFTLDTQKKEKEEEGKLDKKFKEELDRETRELTAKHEAETQARTDLSGDQAQLLISAHNQELEELQLKLKNQHNRQRAELREKMNARRARKKKALSNRQEMEEEREKLELKKKLLLDEALKPLLEKYYNDRDAMVAKYESELVKLDNQELPEDELKKLKEKLRREHEKELSELDEDHQKSKAKIEKDINDQVDLELAQEKLHLKERHYKEFADSLRELAPSANQQETAEEAEKRAKRMEQTKEKLEQERLESEKRFAEERRVLEEEEQERINYVMKEFEKELEVENEADKKKQEKTLNNLARRKEKLLKDKREKIKEEIARAAAAGASEEEQQKILDQHERDVENLTNKMDREKLRMQTQLEERLKNRRKEKLKAKKEALKEEKKEAQRSVEERQKEELNKINKEQIKAIEESTELPSSRQTTDLDIVEPRVEQDTLATNSQPALFTGDNVVIPAFVPTAPAISESDLHEMLKNSPLQKTLEDIKRVLSGRKQAPPKEDGKKTDEKKDSTGKERKAFT